MSYVRINRITPSKFGEGDRWRLEIDGEWYDAYLTSDAGQLQPGDYEVEFKTSPKSGKVYAVAIDGKYRTQGGASRPPAAAQQIPGTAPRAPAPVPTLTMLASQKPGERDMWIMATSICQAVIAKGESWEHGALVELAREAANAARAAARVFEAAPIDAAKAAAERPAVPVSKRAPALMGDPEDPRNAGPDFDDDIPF